jgi:hypothetical protein
MSAPVENKFVPLCIEPDSPPSVTEPKVLEAIASFVEGLETAAVIGALEAYWRYKDGVLRRAVDSYAVFAVCPFGAPKVACRGGVSVDAAQKDGQGPQFEQAMGFSMHLLACDAKVIAVLMLPRLDETGQRSLLRLVILLYANDRMQTIGELAGEALRKALADFDDVNFGTSRWQTRWVSVRDGSRLLGMWWGACEKERLWEALCLHEPPVAVVARILARQSLTRSRTFRTAQFWDHRRALARVNRGHRRTTTWKTIRTEPG